MCTRTGFLAHSTDMFFFPRTEVIRCNAKALLLSLDVFKVHLVCSFSVDVVLREFIPARSVSSSITIVSSDRRILSDLWFLQAAPQEAIKAPGTRSCIYPFSFYHLHGILQFFTYGVIFPIGYLVGRHAGNLTVKRPLHITLQVDRASSHTCHPIIASCRSSASFWLLVASALAFMPFERRHDFIFDTHTPLSASSHLP